MRYNNIHKNGNKNTPLYDTTELGKQQVNQSINYMSLKQAIPWQSLNGKIGKVHPCTGNEALYRPYGP
jgi:hypothetical protein